MNVNTLTSCDRTVLPAEIEQQISSMSLYHDRDHKTLIFFHTISVKVAILYKLCYYQQNMVSVLLCQLNLLET